MSVLMSVADTLPRKPILHTQLDLEARVGIGRLKPICEIKLPYFKHYSSKHWHYLLLHRHYPFADVFADSLKGKTADLGAVEVLERHASKR
jgi:hypothetical protein